ncbi:hypothetical protein N7448_003450 [Penicillium atrosanguineum]|uniref:D-mandelate dehydrogenase n=1 Tax=Penicillium atrosanguineum TaxID=1132637 RepID=A0A9W9H7C6_9EURO|nr:hypothetical protein N7526_009255 [Penicillium atrosanguineum]KAJ5140042.1 hypothetical protein N7448_003450 [Penicillium atrosanguineum]KAJ5315475.1 hypothetical protein N7476_005782 [Penicillium atrosanguineum]
MASENPIVLHLGDPVEFNKELFAQISEQFTVIRPSLEERQRDAFLKALKEKKWGNFQGIFRPFWNTGGEMGRWDAELIPLLPSSLKVYGSAGAGYDWMDVDILADHGILYCNGAQASSEAVADMAIFHIISVFRNMQWSMDGARSGDPNLFLEAHRGTQITAHNPQTQILGIIGLGNIGYTIARKAYACFGMKIYYQDLYRKPTEQENAIGASFCQTLDDLLAVADCIVLATPFGGSKLITKETLAKFKKGSKFVNIARGTLVDEDALVGALKSGHLSAVGLDVHDSEPNVNKELAKMRNVTLTAHTAGGAAETMIGFERLSMENVQHVLTGQEALTPVNKHMFK